MSTTRARTRWQQRLGGFVLALALIAGIAAAATAAAAPISAVARQVLTDAATSEYKALAIYQAIVKKVANKKPFSSWVRCVPEYIDANLKPLFDNYGLVMPPVPDPAKVAAPASFRDACRLASKIENEKVAMYEQLLKTVKEADIVAALTVMRDEAKQRLDGVLEHCK
ncbi:MAG: hypothetical protein RDU83_10600 [bacterium]|nr:hypothetical protein [bacterium]